MRSLARPVGSTGLLKLSLLAGAAFVSSPAFAQEVAIPAATATTTGEETTGGQDIQSPTAAAEEADANGIVVTGRRPIAESEAAALRVQRASDSLVSVLSSDSVGRLPDQNIAQAVSRLPGISVQRDQGQARYINLRGAPLNWTTLSFNGINVISPEGRDARFDSIPSVIAKQVIVSKAVTPDMSGETIAGNVNIITRSAFDAPGTRFSGKLAYGLEGLGPQDEFEGSALISGRKSTGIGHIGILISGSYYARGLNTDNFETDFEQVPQDTRPGNESRFWARETERKFYRATRRNYSFSGRLDWAPDNNNRIYAESIFTTFNDDEQRDNYIFDLDDQQSSTAATNALRQPCPAVAPTSPPTGTSGYADICLNDPFRGTVYGVDINSNILIRRYRQRIFTNTLAGDHDFESGWAFKWRGNYTKSVDDRSAPAQFNFGDTVAFSNAVNRPTVQYDFTDPHRSVIQLFRTLNTGGALSRGAAVASILDFSLPLTRVRVSDLKDTTTAYTGRVELEKEFDLGGGESRFRFGLQYDKRDKRSVNEGIDLSGSALTALLAAQPFFPRTGQEYAGSDTYVGTIPPGYDVRFFDIPKLFSQASLLRSLYPLSPLTANDYDVREEVRTAYAIYQGKFGWGSVIGGVRFENVRNRSNAFSSVTTVTNPGTTPPTTTTVNTPVSAKSEESLWFPSLHVNVDLTRDTKFRIGFTSGAARPDYDQLRPNLTVDDGNRTISGGNPAAKPERAYGVDSYLEWYVRPQGFVSVGVFYKRVEDVLFNSRRTFGSDSLNFGGTDRSDYTFTGLVNGGKGYIYGAEGAFQMQLEPFTSELGLPSWMGGFGLNTNLVLNKSKVTKLAVPGSASRKTRLPGTSDVTYNIGFYYEKYGLSLRAQYQSRSKWLDFVADTLVDGGDGYWAKDGELDFSARYEVRKGVELLFDAANLTNGPGRRYTGDSRYTIEYEKFGRRYIGGVRLTF